MITYQNDKLTIRQACYLAIILLAVYYPLTVFVNFGVWTSTIAAPIFPLLVFMNFVFYAAIILVFDRLINWAERKFNLHLVTEFRIPTFLFCIVFAAVAVWASDITHMSSFQKVQEVIGIKKLYNPDLAKREFSALDEERYQQWRNMNMGLKFVIVLSILYITINRKANVRMKDIEVQAEQLKKENAQAQYQALKNQVSPHFLFNSLSILSSLVHIDPKLSEKFIDQLSKAYRYILEQKDNDSISLKTELDFIRSYAFLLKIRFEEKFDLKIELNETEANDFHIAPLTLQLLIENAVKHNKMSADTPLQVTIRKENEFLIVENAIRRLQSGEGVVSTGIGLKNIVKRYQLLTEIPVEISSDNNIFRVKIPLLS